ncbi:MAG: YbhB/YbcL family Raf kinase inhibitor-like protein [Nitrospiraceae bacterium]|nr:YbhB/YbcL family Raf kinase inhibitor-like protein [Nitrospiraceae bacterium]
MEKTGTLAIKSPAFEENRDIPTEYTCEGRNINPPLVIENIPAGAKSLALIVIDPDAPSGTWTHWLVWNIPPETREIKANSVPSGASQGLNDARKKGYYGPCPPSGIHHYIFKLYALDAKLDLKDPGIKRAELERAIRGHVISETEITGLYGRRR